MSNTSRYLKAINLEELKFILRRTLHLKYTHLGRFSKVSVSDEEKARLAEIHDFHARRTPVPLTVIHGIAPRSGTNYILDLLRVHPDAHFDSSAMPEIPLLSITKDTQALQTVYLQRYRGNERSLGSLDFLSHLAHGLMLKPHEDNGDKAGLFKVPHVHHLNLFPSIFPSYKLIICVRDGRDVVASATRTWGDRGVTGRKFKDFAREWARSANIINDVTKQLDESGFPYKLVRYEDAFDAPLETARELSAFMGLDPEKLTEETYADMKVRGSSQGGKAGARDWSKDNIKRDENFKPVGRWNEWPESQKQAFAKIAGKELAMFGYE